MSPVTHFLAGWMMANTAALSRRERACVTLAAVAADVDGLGIVAELATRNTAHPLRWWSDYHHVFGHNLLFGLVVTAIAAGLARQRGRTALLAFLSFHSHLLGDLVGARGPDGYHWPIPYLWPFSTAWIWEWSGQWALNAWPNFVLTSAMILVTLWLAWRRGFSPLEMVSARADRAVVETLRARLGHVN